MAKQLKKWQGWMLFGGSMLIVFVLGLLCFSLLERRAEVASVFNNRRVPMTDSIVAQNEKFKEDFPREYETWAMTADTTFKSMYNGSQERDILKAFPDIVIIWYCPKKCVTIISYIFHFVQNYLLSFQHLH